MQIEMRSIGSIKPYPGNPRHNDAAVDAVAASIGEFGFRQPLVIDEAGVIVVGHTRYKAALKLGMTEVPVHVATGLTKAQLKSYRLADNRTAQNSTWDEDRLTAELMELQSLSYDLKLTGFSAEELSVLMAPSTPEGLTDPDTVPEAPDEAITQSGDLWVLGQHRLLCGDSTIHEQIERLMDGATARMMFTDPPWNVGIGMDSNPRHRQRPGLRNDSLPAADFRSFLDGFIGSIKHHVMGDVYCVLGASEWPTLDSALRGHEFHWSATIIWVKDAFVLGRSKYHRRYEPIWYGWHSAGKSSFGPDRDLDDVWEVPRPKRSDEHPTMKPVDLIVKAIENSSRAGDVVVDPFGGSGSTLIAAEKLGRKAFLMELEPLYCDVIVHRYEQFTGKKAEHVPA